MEKQLQKYQHKNTLSNKYSQTFTSPSYLEPKTNQYTTETKSYHTDYQQQYDSKSFN